MKKYISILLLIILLIYCFNISTFAQESDDTITFYYDSPEGFTNDNTVICSLWCGRDYIRVTGKPNDNGLYEFTIPDFSKYEGLVFDNNKTVTTDKGHYNENDYKFTETFFLYNGELCLDRYGNIEGSPDNLVLTNQVYYDNLSLSSHSRYYAFGEWLTLSQWHRSNIFNKQFIENGADYPDVVYPNETSNLWYLYDELYIHNNKNGELTYSLAFGATPNKTKEMIYEVYDNYILRQDETYSPDPFGYYIYLSEADRYVTLKEAFELNVPDIEAVFTTYGLGELLGDVDCDKNLSVMDATKIQRCLADLDQFNINDEVANNNIESFNDNANINIMYISDFNRDGTRNIFDATAIQCFVAGINS